MTRDRATLTETERDDLCDAMVDYTSNRAAAAPARFDKHVVPTVERIIAARVAEARRDEGERVTSDAETLRQAAAAMRDPWSGAADRFTRPPGGIVPARLLSLTLRAVADWLDFEARICERADANYPERAPQAADEHALAVARAHLGERP